MHIHQKVYVHKNPQHPTRLYKGKIMAIDLQNKCAGAKCFDIITCGCIFTKEYVIKFKDNTQATFTAKDIVMYV